MTSRALPRPAVQPSDAMRFALGGWVFNAPDEPVWFRDAAWMQGDSVRRQDYEDLECSHAIRAK